MAVRAKFKLVEKTEYVGFNAIKLTFSAVCDDGIPENARFAKYTPSGQLTMQVDNPSAVEYLTEGKEYYLDFTKAS